MALFPAAFWVHRRCPVSPSQHSSCLSEEIHRCLVSGGLIHRDFLPFNSWRTDTNWTVAVVQLVNDPPSAAGFVYTARSPG